jgi:hypothetical protein
MIFTALKLTFLCLFLGLARITTTSELNSIQQDDAIVYSENEPGTHDAKCNCDYCTEPIETEYYMEIAGIDSTIKLGQNLTVISIDTVENTTCISLK